mmetsp:Transcript_8500/g.11466  ORF Transcript_8500/g.11466 Transcript_8500/m.11466 type:complete len:118 (+) Transcript_8500:214-567(+)
MTDVLLDDVLAADKTWDFKFYFEKDGERNQIDLFVPLGQEDLFLQIFSGEITRVENMSRLLINSSLEDFQRRLASLRLRILAGPVSFSIGSRTVGVFYAGRTRVHSVESADCSKGQK